jgi:hypothetical protein
MSIKAIREAIGAERSQIVGAGRVEHPVVDGRVGWCALASTGDELAARIDADHACAVLRHAARESSRAAGDIEDRVARRDVQQAFGGRLDEQCLEVIAVADAIVPPARIRIPDPAVLVGVFRKVGIHQAILPSC